MERNNEVLAQLIWPKYKAYKRGREVIRSGFGLCGAYGDTYAEGLRRDSRSFETILEHQAATALLAVMILKLFPTILPRTAHQRLIELMLMHDVVEVESGDLADDGHLDKSEKAQNEHRAMVNFTEGVWNSTDAPLLHDFDLLESTNGEPTDATDGESLFGQLAFMIDKMEAILQLAFFESQGVRPNLTYKLAHFGDITERDRFYMDLTNSDKALDIWTAHFYDFAKSYKEFWLPKAVIEHAYFEVRSYSPRWTDRILINPMVRLWPLDKT